MIAPRLVFVDQISRDLPDGRPSVMVRYRLIDAAGALGVPSHQCAEPECDTPIPAMTRRGRPRLYCDEHGTRPARDWRRKIL